MTIDERLERLNERHDALTKTVELIAAGQTRADERVAQVTADIGKLTTLMAETGRFINRLDRLEGE